MPRREIVHTFDRGAPTVPMARRGAFRPGLVAPILRLAVWLRVGAMFVGGNVLDVLRRRSSPQRRAVRLRVLFESAGGSFAKIAQQLALRADLIPYAYCVELSKLLDRAPALPTAEAIAIVERNLAGPLGSVFDSFDPQPIGSASIGCVYQGRLRSGELVAVKVQRPKIDRKISADLRALDWLLGAAEALTIVRPGLTGSFRREVRRMLMGELNFLIEARNTDIFRARAKGYGKGVTAPRIFFEYCTEHLMVSELVSGISMWELMGAVDRGDQSFLAEAAAIGIEPKSLASKLIHVMYQDMLEEFFFHADPHPANIIVQPDNGICFIDFGAVGRFSTKTRNAWRELNYHLGRENISQMAVCSMLLAGPLPPIDVDRILKAVEGVFAEWLVAIKSPDAEWWERSNATNWLQFINVSSQFGIAANFETIQFFRAMMLYDGIVMRLDKNVDFDLEWRSYCESAGKAAKKRVRRSIRRRLGGPTEIDYLRLEQAKEMIEQFMFKARRRIDEPIVHFRYIAGKVSDVISSLLRVGYVAIVGGIAAVVADRVAMWRVGHGIAWSTVIGAVLSYRPLQFALLIAVFLGLRSARRRIKEPDIPVV